MIGEQEVAVHCIWLRVRQDFRRLGLQAGDCVRIENRRPEQRSYVALGSRELWTLGQCYLGQDGLWVRLEGENGATGHAFRLGDLQVMGVSTGFCRELKGSRAVGYSDSAWTEEPSVQGEGRTGNGPTSACSPGTALTGP